MKTFLAILSLSLLNCAQADSITGTPFDYKNVKFAACEKPSCEYVLCEQGETVDSANSLPYFGCMKAMRKNKDGVFVLDYYEIGVKMGLPEKTKEECGNKPCKYDFPAVLLRVR